MNVQIEQIIIKHFHEMILLEDLREDFDMNYSEDAVKYILDKLKEMGNGKESPIVPGFFFKYTSFFVAFLSENDFWDYNPDDETSESEDEDDMALEKEGMEFEDEYLREEKRIENEIREMSDLEEQMKALSTRHEKRPKPTYHQKRLEEAELKIPYCTNVNDLCSLIHEKIYREGKIKDPKSEVDQEAFQKEFYKMADHLFPQ